MQFKDARKLAGALALTALGAVCTPALGDDIQGDDGFREISMLWYIGGTQEYFACEVPITDLGTTEASCHEHLLLDLRRDRVIGTALDATADVFAVGDALYATGTTTFELTAGPFAGSTLQVRGTGTIQPTIVGNPHFEWKSRAVDGKQTPISHIAGIFPDPDQNMVLDGTGVFEGATGTFALFGGLDVASDPDAGSFNCIFKIDLKLPRRNLETTAGASLAF